MNVSPTDGTGPTQGQRKTLIRVGIEPTTFGFVFGSKHKAGTCNNRESAIKDHAENMEHDICVNCVQILEKNVNNWHKRIFPGIVALYKRQECSE